MHSLRKYIRVVSAFLLINFLYATFTPTISYALTSGPTAPEATSFEPIDTTDMVNPLTGEFTYNLPLLEVPGPSGGYPLSLSYHAGIQTNEEASWVGLGWTLNPGAITRSVSGYADDFQDVTGVDRTFWEGGETTSYTLGVSYGISNAVSASAGLNFSQDTYRGFGIGGYLGVGFGSQIGSAVSGGVGIQMGISPYGSAYSSAGINVGIGTGEENSVNVGINTGLNYNSVSGASLAGGPSVSYNFNSRNFRDTKKFSGSLIGASISTNNSGSLSVSAGGAATGVSNSKIGTAKIRSINNVGDIPTPIPGLSIRLGKSYQRYWSDERESVETNGALYFPDSKLDEEDLNNSAYDTYDLQELNGENIDIEGSFPDYDNYSVAAQGLFGTIRPFNFQKNLYRQNKRITKDDQTVDDLIICYPLSNEGKQAQFRFEGDFSNRYLYNPSDFDESTNFDFEYDGFETTGDQTNNGFSDNYLAGSKHIEWYSNAEIVNGQAKNDGFIEGVNVGHVRKNGTSIGGFKITNESGVTYHFSLPAYSHNEFTYSESTDDEGKISFNQLKRKTGYAYTWFLTGITGPDFVDRSADGSPNGLLDENDWGYWVNFEYGLWTSKFKWRNPGQGFHADIDNKFRNFSKGEKDIYYLNKINTATHTALFIKELRKDAKSSTSENEEAVVVINDNVDPSIEYVDEGEFNKINRTLTYEHYDAFDDLSVNHIPYDDHPYSTLKLNKIYLLKNEDVIPDLNSRNGTYQYTSSFNYLPLWYGDPDRVQLVYSQNGNNILDIHDISDVESDIDNHSIRSINFNTDYSLAQLTPNSFVSEMDVVNTSQTADPIGATDGKLTLNSLEFLGKNGVKILPQTYFYYDKNPDYNKDHYDMWGFYKSDYQYLQNENLSRMTTQNSAFDVDAWSLTRIKSNLGSNININYQSNDYLVSNLGASTPIRIKSFDNQDPFLRLNIEDGVEITDYFNAQERAKVKVVYHVYESILEGSGAGNVVTDIYEPIETDVDIVSVGDNYIDVLLSDFDVMYYNGIGTDPVTGLDTEIRHTPFGGNIGNVNLDGSKYGGGLRAKSISIRDPFLATSSETFYEYSFDGKTSGITTYEPFILDKYFIYDTSEDHEGVKALKNLLASGMNEIVKLAREIPGPGVMYQHLKKYEQKVNENGSVQFINGSSEYEFEVFDLSMIGIHEARSPNQSINGTIASRDYDVKITKNIALKNYLSRIGKLRSLTLKNNDGMILSKTQNHYLYEQVESDNFQDNINNYEPLLTSRYEDQGVIEETFADARFARNSTELGWHFLAIINKKESFPSIQTGQTTINYKTGITTTTENLAFDFYSGAVTKTRSTDGYGNIFETETIPAYRKYGGTDGMGLAINGGKNMLTQTAADYSWKVDENGTKESLISASIRTWKDHWAYVGLDGEAINVENADTNPVWRKHESYSYIGNQSNLKTNTDGLVAFDPVGFDDFEEWSATGGEPASVWQKNSEITLYDRYSHALEAKDLYGHFAATKMDSKQEKVLATVANASYNEFAYSGAEDTESSGYFGGAVSKGLNATVFTTTDDNHANVHTGWSSISVSSGDKAFDFVATASATRDMKVSVWSSQNDGVIKYKLNGGTTQSISTKVRTSGNWHLLTAYLPTLSQGDELQVWCEAGGSAAYFDDFRVHPHNAPMTAYVYNEFDELAFVLDNNNLYTEYIYDDMGRLAETYRESFKYGRKKISEYSVHYSKEPDTNK